MQFVAIFIIIASWTDILYAEGLNVNYNYKIAFAMVINAIYREKEKFNMRFEAFE